MAPEEEGLRAWAALLRTHAAVVPLIDRELQLAAGLPLAWYDALLELNSAPQRRLRMTDLGNRVVLSRTRVSRIVDELVGAGFVSRDDNPADRRSAYAVITAEGRRRLRAAAPVYRASIDRHFAARLPRADVARVRMALERVLQAESPPPARADKR